MTKRLSASACVACLLLIAFAPTSTAARRHTTRDAVKARLAKLMKEYYQAWNTLDPDNADRFYDRAADLVFYDIAPLKYKGWAEYKESVRAVLAQYSSFKLIPRDDLDVRHSGDMAVTTLTLHLSAVHKSAGPLEIDARHTAVWERRGDRWVIVHEHISAPLPG